MKLYLLLFFLINISSFGQEIYELHVYNQKGDEYLNGRPNPTFIMDSILVVKIRMHNDISTQSLFKIDTILFVISGKRPICEEFIKASENGEFTIKKCYSYSLLKDHGAFISIWEKDTRKMIKPDIYIKVKLPHLSFRITFEEN